MNKNDILDSIVVEVNALIDAKGIDKCRLAIDIVQKLAALKEELHESETDIS